MRNIKLVLAYDGTHYHGFQVQNRTGLKTIQEELEKALYVLTGERTNVYGSGRTDAGVHAHGQVVNFLTNSGIPFERFPLAINSVLPRDIVVWQAQEVSLEFHARYSAKKKTYCYSIYNDRYLSPFWRFYAYHVPVALDTDKMMLGAKEFIGRHDFSAFCAKNTSIRDYVRTIYDCRLEKESALLRVSITGDGFLYNMVRIIAGTLVEIGENKRSYENIPDLLHKRERKLAGRTLPPQGLCLCSVEY